MRMPHRRPKVLDSPYFEPEAAAGIALSSQLSKGRTRIVGEAGKCELRAIQDAITGVGGQHGLQCVLFVPTAVLVERSEEHTSELQSLMRISYAVFCLKKHKEQNVSRLLPDKH